MKKRIVRNSSTRTTLAVFGAVALLAAAPARADTSWVSGGNWASDDGTITDIQYPDGITSSTTTTEAAGVADTVAGDYEMVGINFVRYPINPATVSGNWAVTQAAINELIADGLTVDICCWYVDWENSGTITNMTTWENMWKTVDGVYGNNNAVYYEPINEPHGYTLSGLESVYSTFLGLGLKKGQDHIILDGTGYADNVTGIGGDSSFNSCLLAVHDYSFWATHTTDAAWSTDLYDRVYPYQGRTIMTEFGAPTTTGLNFGTANSGDNDICFVRGMCNQIISWGGMGAVWFPAHQAGTGNNKRMFNGPGQGIINPSLVDEVEYGWGNGWGNSTISTANGPVNFNVDGRMEMVGVKTNGNVYHQYITDSGSWSGWAPLGSGFTARQVGGCMGRNSDGRLEAFVIGASDGAVYHMWQTNAGGSWNGGWNLLSGFSAAKSGCTVISDSAGYLNVFVLGSDNRIWTTHQTSSGGWSTWLGMGDPDYAMSGQTPAVGINSDGRLEVFWNTTTNTAVYHIWQTAPFGSWSSPASLGGGNNLSGCTVGKNQYNNLEVFVVGSDNTLWHDWYSGSSWSGWSSLESGFKLAAQTPVVGDNLDEREEVFANDYTNGVVNHDYLNSSGAWSSFHGLGGNSGNLSGPKVVLDRGYLNVFVVGSDNAIWTANQSNWGVWTSLGGTFSTF